MDLFYPMNLQHCKLNKPKTLKYWETVHIFSLYLLECFWLQETKILAETDLDNMEVFCHKTDGPQVRVSGFVDLAAQQRHRGPRSFQCSALLVPRTGFILGNMAAGLQTLSPDTTDSSKKERNHFVFIEQGSLSEFSHLYPTPRHHYMPYFITCRSRTNH